MRKQVNLIILFLFLINSGIVCASDEILLKSRRFTPAKGMSDAAKAKIEAIPGRAHVLIQLQHIPTIAERKEFEAKGINLLSYVPSNAWFASIPSDKSSQVAALSNVRAISEILPEDKIASQIRERGVNEYSTNEKDEAKLVVLFFADVSLNDARIVIESYAGTFVGAAPIINALVIYLPKGLINELASDDSVKWINQHYKPFMTNDGTRAAIGVDTIQAPPYNLKGTGVITGEWDGGWVDTTHDDLEGRVTIGDTGSVTHEHSTHVAGTMLGDGTLSDGTYRGMAPNSIVISYELWNDVDELNYEYETAINIYGIDLSTNSWGYHPGGPFPRYGAYDEGAKAIDNVVVGACGERIPIMWAAGNQRPLCDNNMYDCIILPGTAKNIITIGATNSNDDSMTSFSSWGPTNDGRIKPDVVAPGCEHEPDDNWYNPNKSIWSTIPDLFVDMWYRDPDTGHLYCPPDDPLPPCPDGIDDFYYPYDGMCGTSMATPAVAGSAALMIQRWRNIHDGNDPLPSTIKAILIQTAKPLGNKGPDYSYGYGRIDVKEAIDLIDDANVLNNIFEDSIVDQNDTDHYDVNVPEGKGELVVTLVWDDYPGDPAADKALVNDLDLIVKDPNGNRYYPWTLDPDIPNKTARRNEPDRINNIEQVCVYHPVNSTWSIDVNGANVPEPAQKYSLVYSFNVIPQHTDKFRVKNSSGESVAWFDDSGSLYLKGTLTTGADPLVEDPNHDEFRVQDTNGLDVAIINTTDGNMCIKGSRKTVWQDPSAGNDEFIIRNSDEPVAYINHLGDMYLKGKLHENYTP